jgi:thymidylate synthase
MIAEWLWIMSSSEDVGTLAKYNSKMAEYSDDGFILNGAYGPRLMPQMPYILEALSKKDTRQAVATIWTPNPSPSKDVPCTISLQWMIREDKLHTTVNMRSSDAWLGLPYDFFNFSQISNVIAGQLNIDVGSVTMNLASSHLYRSQFKKAEEVIKNYRGVGYLESPPIPDVNQLPYELFLNSSLLNHGIQGAHEPWISYSLALQHSKEKALEVLHAIAPK